MVDRDLFGRRSDLEARLRAVLDPPLGQGVEDDADAPPRSDFDLNDRPTEMVGRALRPAAVLAPLIYRDGWRLLLTQRAKTLVRHAGQIAFPGGRVDADDASAADAALREAQEEVGLSRSQVRLLGRFEPYETMTGFSVIPFVGVVDPPFTPIADPNEVADVFEVDLAQVLDPACIVERTRLFQGAQRRYFQIEVGPHVIWGATAGMLKALCDRLWGSPRQSDQRER